MNLPVSPHQYTLISILMDAGTPLLSKDLSAKTGISTRSVKKNIAELNDLLAEKKLYISSNTHKGYWIENKDSFLQWFREMDTSSPVPMTHNQRIIYCLFHLLKYDHPSPTTQWIADSLYVSKATISSVFKEEVEAMCYGRQTVDETINNLVTRSNKLIDDAIAAAGK